MALFFTNYSDQPFEHKWDGVATIIAPGETRPFRVDAIGEHCAKHFVTAMMIKDGKDADILNDSVRAEYREKCVSAIEGQGDEAFFEEMKRKAREEVLAEAKEDKPKAKPKAKAKAKPKASEKEEAKEEEFEGLED